MRALVRIMFFCLLLVCLRATVESQMRVACNATRTVTMDTPMLHLVSHAYPNSLAYVGNPGCRITVLVGDFPRQALDSLETS